MSAPRVTIDQLPEQTAAVSSDLLVVQNAGATKKMTVQRITDVPAAALNGHVTTVTDAHDASAISALPGNPLTGTDVQTQLTQISTALTDLLARVAALEAAP